MDMSIEVYRHLFHQLRANGGETIQLSQAQYGGKKLGIETDLDSIRKILQYTGAGCSEYLAEGQFIHLMFVLERADMDSEASVLFYAADTDHDMLISPQELRQILFKLGLKRQRDEVDAALTKVCPGGNELTYEQFNELIDAIS